MKKVVLSVLVLVGVGGLFMAISSPSSTSNDVQNNTLATQSNKPNMDEINTALASGSLLLDVRTAEEFASGHFEQATLLPLADIQAGLLPEVDKTKPLYVYCRSGNRSAEAVALLREAGYANVIDLGGLSDVAALGGKQVR